MNQLAFQFDAAPAPLPVHCSNCDPSLDAANLAILSACDVDWLRKCIAGLQPGLMDLSRCTPEERAGELHHQAHRLELFETTLERRLAGDKRTSRANPRELILCREGCGTLVHACANPICRPCAQRRAKENR